MAKEIIGSDEFRGARFQEVDMEGVRIRDANLQNAILVEVDLLNASIEGRIDGMTVKRLPCRPPHRRRAAAALPGPRQAPREHGRRVP